MLHSVTCCVQSYIFTRYSGIFRAWKAVNSGRQVERIQHFTHLLADPNREPERGEVYLSQCFRHAAWTIRVSPHMVAIAS